MSDTLARILASCTACGSRDPGKGVIRGQPCRVCSPGADPLPLIGGEAKAEKTAVRGASVHGEARKGDDAAPAQPGGSTGLKSPSSDFRALAARESATPPPSWFRLRAECDWCGNPEHDCICEED